ncbi:hypothetical protein CCGE525_14120 [Rhizobium jaguaris]|uniref:Uncharacterized protein n=1 Tax=Rhizobium jaguaris TaxID=1312183 RepID=A0A387FLR7_9HYPH|nr:hypothetical protein CCGE525_14120 [Rhizobium jaguaris]
MIKSIQDSHDVITLLQVCQTCSKVIMSAASNQVLATSLAGLQQELAVATVTVLLGDESRDDGL